MPESPADGIFFLASIQTWLTHVGDLTPDSTPWHTLEVDLLFSVLLYLRHQHCLYQRPLLCRNASQIMSSHWRRESCFEDINRSRLSSLSWSTYHGCFLEITAQTMRPACIYLWQPVSLLTCPFIKLLCRLKSFTRAQIWHFPAANALILGQLWLWMDILALIHVQTRPNFCFEIGSGAGYRFLFWKEGRVSI